MTPAKQLKKIEQSLDEACVPEEVFIGTNSIADRVKWLIARNEMHERTLKELRSKIRESLK